MDLFARGFRRAHLPLRMSQGFNPRPRFSLPVPLALGIEGQDEVLELDLLDNVEPDALAEQLRRQMPADIDIRGVERVPSDRKARPHCVTYHVTGQLPPGAAERCLASEHFPTMRNDKRIDIRPYLQSIRTTADGCDCDVLVTNEGTARPAEIVDALTGGDAQLARHLSLSRTAVNLAPQ